jgi:hypothetical protein
MYVADMLRGYPNGSEEIKEFIRGMLEGRLKKLQQELEAV